MFDNGAEENISIKKDVTGGWRKLYNQELQR
jgi:hypothetical protein